MFLLRIWRRITSSRAREQEAAVQRENAQRESALREEFARRTHALETQVAQAHAENCRLRAENRALLNSVLGIAGIPPVIVAEPPVIVNNPPSAAAEPDLPFVGTQHAVPACPAGRPGADACLDPVHPATAPIPHSRHPERQRFWSEGSLFVSPGCLDAIPKRGPSSLIKPAPQDDGAIDGRVSAYGTTTPSSFAGRSSAAPLQDQSPDNSTPLGTNGSPLQNEAPVASAPAGTNAAPPQKQPRRARAVPRPRNDANVIAPIRRRSWHQIYRMLEFESSRRKEREP